jgi:tetratricopeptide (TPR) repeat protein
MMRNLTGGLGCIVGLVGLLSLSAMAEDLALCREGKALYRDGDYSGAISRINLCISEGDLSDEARACAVLNRGRCYLAMQQPDKGLGDVRSAISRDRRLGESEKAAACLGIPESEAVKILDAAN